MSALRGRSSRDRLQLHLHLHLHLHGTRTASMARSTNVPVRAFKKYPSLESPGLAPPLCVALSSMTGMNVPRVRVRCQPSRGRSSRDQLQLHIHLHLHGRSARTLTRTASMACSTDVPVRAFKKDPLSESPTRILASSSSLRHLIFNDRHERTGIVPRRRRVQVRCQLSRGHLSRDQLQL